MYLQADFAAGVWFLAAVQEAFGTLAKSLDRGTAASLLKGPVAQRGFYRLT